MPPRAETNPAARVEVVVSSATVAKAVAIALGAFLVVRAADVVLAVGVALVLALGLDPLVGGLTRRRGMSRVRAALLVFAAPAALVLLLVVWAATPLWKEVRGLAAALPGYVRDLEDEPVLRELAGGTGAGDEAHALTRDAADAIPEAAAALLGIAGALVGSALGVVTLVFLTLFLLIALPDLKRAGLSLLPPDRAARVDRLAGEVTGTIFNSLLGNVAISVLAGVVAGVAAVLVGAPYPVVLAVLVGLFDLIPQVGSLLAAAIVVAVTLAGAGLAPAAVVLAVILVYQQVENYVIQPLVYRGAAALSGFATSPS